MPSLFDSISLRELVLPNRIVVSPMCQYSATDGEANDWHLLHLGTMAASGAGLVTIEATAVEAQGRITPGDLGLWDDRTQAALARVIAAIRRYTDAKISLQLGHAGRKGSSHTPWDGGQALSAAEGAWETPAPSALPHLPTDPLPTALDEEGLARIRNAFASAAHRAVRLGVDAIEIHGGHGYLLHQFLSPLSNQRSDSYGGVLENRLRYPLEIFDAVRNAVPDAIPVGFKVSATDWVEGGWDIEQSVVLAGALQNRGVDWVAASSGGVSPLQKIAPAPGYQVPFATRIKAGSGARVMAVGLITEPAQADGIISSGQADMVALARAMLYDPRWPWHAAAALGAKVSAPRPYWRAPPQPLAGIFNDSFTGIR
jgi:NADPH2 dehydrogenase